MWVLALVSRSACTLQNSQVKNIAGFFFSLNFSNIIQLHKYSEQLDATGNDAILIIKEGTCCEFQAPCLGLQDRSNYLNQVLTSPPLALMAWGVSEYNEGEARSNLHQCQIIENSWPIVLIRMNFLLLNKLHIQGCGNNKCLMAQSQPPF